MSMYVDRDCACCGRSFLYRRSRDYDETKPVRCSACLTLCGPRAKTCKRPPMKTEEVELASTERFKVKLTRKQRRAGMPEERGLTLEQLEEYLALARCGELAPDVQARYVSAEIRPNDKGFDALFMVMKVLE